MKYLVTGGAGFIGCNAAQRWMQRGHEVVVLDDLSRRGADRNLAWLETQGRFVFERVDIRDAAALDAAVARHRDTQVVAPPRRAGGGHHLGHRAAPRLRGQRARHLQPPRVGAPPRPARPRSSTPRPTRSTAASSTWGWSSATAGTPSATAPRASPRTEPLDFHSPYGCSKGAADQYVRDYARIYGLRTVELPPVAASTAGASSASRTRAGWPGSPSPRSPASRSPSTATDGRCATSCSSTTSATPTTPRWSASIGWQGRSSTSAAARENTLSLLELVGRAGPAHRPAPPPGLRRLAPRGPAGLRRRRPPRRRGPGLAAPDRRPRGRGAAPRLGGGAPRSSSPERRAAGTSDVGQGCSRPLGPATECENRSVLRQNRPDPHGPGASAATATERLAAPCSTSFPPRAPAALPPVRRLAAALEERSQPVSLSLQGKILVSHVLLAVVLVGTLHLVRERAGRSRSWSPRRSRWCWRCSSPRCWPGSPGCARWAGAPSTSPAETWPARSPPSRAWAATRSTSSPRRSATCRRTCASWWATSSTPRPASPTRPPSCSARRRTSTPPPPRWATSIRKIATRRRDPVQAGRPGPEGHRRDGGQHRAHRRSPPRTRRWPPARPRWPPSRAARRRGSPARR